MKQSDLKQLLDESFEKFNRQEYIVEDPLSIPHEYHAKQDIEITAFFAAMLAWGQRVTIINKCRELFLLMDNRPHDFILNHSKLELERLLQFKHRTFTSEDLLYFIRFLNSWYSQNESLESAFTLKLKPSDSTVENGLIGFHELFFDLSDAPTRTKKHVATPKRKSACKRLNMFLRWMVRHDNRGVDFGLWNDISTSQLVCPFDLHVSRVSRALGLVKRKQDDWQTAIELTENLKKIDALDPVKYDFALFNIGIETSRNTAR